MNDNPKDPAQLSLGEIVTSLPAVRAAKKASPDDSFKIVR
jgi:hypothetical protein